MKSKTSGIGLPTAVIVPHLPEKCYILIQAAGANTILSLRSTGEQLAQLNNVQASSIATARLLLLNQPPLENPGTVNTPGQPLLPPIPLLPDFPLPPIPL
ncbi:MAG: hypothetical protein HC941_08355 [Microcoleus sp. SU_5_3]|nr:hypothetical protein [Microcoleus sp. SU_5_3]